MMTFLSGHRTYLVAGVLALAGFFHAIGKLPDGAYNWIVGILGPAGLASLRAAVSPKM